MLFDIAMFLRGKHETAVWHRFHGPLNEFPFGFATVSFFPDTTVSNQLRKPLAASLTNQEMPMPQARKKNSRDDGTGPRAPCLSSQNQFLAACPDEGFNACTRRFFCSLRNRDTSMEYRASISFSVSLLTEPRSMASNNCSTCEPS